MAEAASVTKGVAALQDEFERSRDRLRGVDETIKKLTGRDPSENRPGQRRIVRAPNIGRGAELGRGRERIFALARYGTDNDRGPPAKRQVIQSAFGRLGAPVRFNRPGPRRDRESGDEDELPRKVTLHSSVVVTPKETRTRTDTLAAQNEDASGKARNRRMFGLLLGTLQRFRDDEKLKVEKEEKRKAVELKVEERAKQDKEDLRRERQSLFNKRRAEQAHIRAIQHKMELAEIHEEWEMQTKQLMKFIRTKTTPHIYYLPKISSTATDSKLKETHDTLQDIISERRRQLEEEIDEVTHHGDDAMEGGNTNHTMGDGVVKTEHTREEEGAQGASGGGGGVDKDRKESDNEDNRSSSDEGEPRGDWGNSNGDSVVVKKDAKLPEDSGKQCKEQASSDSENGEEEKDIVRDEPGKDGDNGEKEKEENHRDKEDRHRDKERGHGDKDKHKDKEDRHRDKEDRHKHKEDRHRDKESRHRYKEDRHRDKEDKHKDKEDKHKDKEDKHKDKDGSQRRHSHRSSRNSHKVESSPCHQKKAHSEDEGDSDEGRNRRKPRSESLSEKTKATKPDSRETEIGQMSDENGDSVIKKDGDMVEAAREEDVVMGEGRTATTKVQEAMED